ncbi:MAG: AarF/UbiB family protein [Thermodesulfobacteriota bacterium]|nr:AarF/UbiB family protein [Thermodesulfobacteriota bacterium]
MSMTTNRTAMNKHRQLPYVSSAYRYFNKSMRNRMGRMAHHSSNLVLNILGNTERLVNDIVRDAFDVTGEADALLADAWERADAVSTAIRSTPRFARIFGEFVRIVADYRLHSVKARFLNADAAAQSLEALHRRSAARIYNLCVEMRGGLIKIGQFASTYVNALPPVYAEYLSKLQDRVPPVPYDAIAHRIESEFERPAEKVFAWIDREPIAAASLAQVHAGELMDGTPVVIKVQMPSIEHTVEIDLAAFKITADLLNDYFPSLGLSEISRALADSVQRELNYREELINIREFEEQCRSDSRIAVPRVYPTVSTRRILTMEKLEGDRLADFLEDAAPERRNRMLVLLAESFCSQIVTHGCFHADPHPGNIFVLPGDRLGLIDFGCVERFSSEIYSLYMQMIGAILTGDADAMARLFDEMGFADAAVTGDSLDSMAADFIELMMLQPGQSLADVDAAQKLARGLELLRQYPSVRVPRHFVLLGRVLLTLGGIMMHHNPDIDVFSLIFNEVAKKNAHDS